MARPCQGSHLCCPGVEQRDQGGSEVRSGQFRALVVENGDSRPPSSTYVGEGQKRRREGDGAENVTTISTTPLPWPDKSKTVSRHLRLFAHVTGLVIKRHDNFMSIYDAFTTNYDKFYKSCVS